MYTFIYEGAPEARVTGAGAVWALCVERGNKRYLAQNHGLLRAISALITDVDAPPQAQRYAASALRNLATDLWVMDCMAAADKDLVKVPLRKCQNFSQPENISRRVELLCLCLEIGKDVWRHFVGWDRRACYVRVRDSDIVESS